MDYFNNKTAKVAVYARVSTEHEAQILALDNQLEWYNQFLNHNPRYQEVARYVDEGITGTLAKKRPGFMQMIEDAKKGEFSLIVTREVSRFARNTEEVLKYVKQLRKFDVDVYFAGDGFRTDESSGELRLTIMSSIAQDEVRKLSERLKFGFRQAIKNGHVLGNDKLYGYDKKDCVLTINEEEAKIVRIIFDLYANHRYGTRKISQKLLEMGYTSREGNAFNVLTIRHMLENPKYKGWYCGNKTQNLDYRTKKKAFLDESEWVTYPDPSIPAIVSEELWDRANALYKERRNEMMSHSSGASFHNRYPYSTKIICEEHGTTFHRQVLTSKQGSKEVWQCKVYRQKGRVACSAPQIRSSELDQIMAEIFTEMMKDKQGIIDSLVTVLMNVPKEVDYEKMIAYVEGEITSTKVKKDRLLDLHIAGAITIEEFKERNDALNDQLKGQESQLAAIRQEQARAGSQELDIDAIRRELDKELSFEEGINTALVATILDKIVVRKDSTKDEIHLDIYLKLGHRFEAQYSPETASASINPPKNTMPTHRIKRI